MSERILYTFLVFLLLLTAWKLCSLLSNLMWRYMDMAQPEQRGNWAEANPKPYKPPGRRLCTVMESSISMFYDEEYERSVRGKK